MEEEMKKERAAQIAASYLKIRKESLSIKDKTFQKLISSPMSCFYFLLNLIKNKKPKPMLSEVENIIEDGEEDVELADDLKIPLEELKGFEEFLCYDYKFKF